MHVQACIALTCIDTSILSIVCGTDAKNWPYNYSTTTPIAKQTHPQHLGNFMYVHCEHVWC